MWVRERGVLVSVFGKSGQGEGVLMSYKTFWEGFWFPKPLTIFVVFSEEKAENSWDSGAYVRRSELRREHCRHSRRHQQHDGGRRVPSRPRPVQRRRHLRRTRRHLERPARLESAVHSVHA